MFRQLLITMRPKQWTKNVFIFAALLFDIKLLDVTYVGRTTLAFILFCILSGSVYLINDLTDIDKDRQHPVKRNRPLPCGKLSKSWAVRAAIVLPIIALSLSFLLQPLFGLIALVYFVIQLFYSFGLKDVVILDVLIIAAGFVLRVAAGSAVAEAERFSPWLYVCITLLALFLALGKRRNELLLLEASALGHRKVLQEYSPQLLDEMVALVTSSTVIAYSLYTFSAENLPPNKSMMLTIPFFLYSIFRYLYLIYQKNLGGSPEEILIRDVPFVISNLCWGITVVLILYIF
ncbi:MAG: decaprenyl-phosphate phosphoribosyltransferase [Chloroflexi bacterium B3_Chlor]|nr:MAG: decaprenyl-phosphate phosphoribosyltransferase [Chloroflexi bacterium B3_Chlor]